MKSARKDIPYVVAYTCVGSLFTVENLFMMGGTTSKVFNVVPILF
jgi:hypothetical protein